MQTQYNEIELEATGKKVRLHEEINVLQSWYEEFLKVVKLYLQYNKATKNQIGVNIGHDDVEVVKGFDTLIELFEKNKITKSFVVTDFGALERYLLSSLKNIEEMVMLKASNVIHTLIKGRGGHE
jgi:hypothetical protein